MSDVLPAALQQIIERKSLSPKQLRRLWARATAAKHFILTKMAPAVATNYTHALAVRSILIEKGICTESEYKEALRGVAEDPKLACRIEASSQAEWQATEDGMVRDIEAKQKQKILETTGVPS